MIEKTKITIGEYSVEIPANGTDINANMEAVLLCLELSGWHKSTINDWIIEYSEELK